MFPEINSKNNERLKYLRKLRNKSFRDQEGTFFIEGTKLFLEAANQPLCFKQIFVTQRWLHTNEDLAFKKLLILHEKNGIVSTVKEEVLQAMSHFGHAEGIVCILEKPDVKPKEYHRAVLLEDIQDPYNVGTIIRTADAAGFDSVITSDKTADIYNEKVLRGSMGSVFHLPVFKVDALVEEAEKLKETGITVIGTALDGRSIWEREPISGSYALVFGNESKGMSSQMKMVCDVHLKIPILGRAESLNVASAAAILMYEMVRKDH